MTARPPFTWIVLGSGSILPRAGHGPAGNALAPTDAERVTLFDCGPGTLRSLGAAGFGAHAIERVVVSHFHPDHCLDLFALAFARRNPSGPACGDLELVGPRGLAALLERGAATFGTRSWTRFERTSVVEVEPGERLERGALELRCAPTRHTPEALAWRAELGGCSVTFSGDSGEVEELAALAAGTDLFACECSFPDDRAVEHHLTPSGAARIARAADVGALLLTHFYPELEPEDARRVAARTFSGRIELAHDLSRHVPAPRPSAERRAARP
ncbi:MAG: MBL fold metallo-hydrolase [Planctomycetes bacterium]|nr:MBL fold metallo-hydrolase [Planctomycetota bacterium]